jgi:hypothetical protein
MSLAKRAGLGADPLEALTTEATPVASVVKRQGRGGARVRPIKLDAELVERARNAVWFLLTHGDPTTTLKSLTERALAAEIARLEAERNGGEAFPEMGRLPAGSRVQPET